MSWKTLTQRSDAICIAFMRYDPHKRCQSKYHNDQGLLSPILWLYKSPSFLSSFLPSNLFSFLFSFIPSFILPSLSLNSSSFFPSFLFFFFKNLSCYFPSFVFFTVFWLTPLPYLSIQPYNRDNLNDVSMLKLILIARKEIALLTRSFGYTLYFHFSNLILPCVVVMPWPCLLLWIRRIPAMLLK